MTPKEIKINLQKGFKDFSLFPKNLQKEIISALTNTSIHCVNKTKKFLKELIKAKVDLKTLHNFSTDWFENDYDDFSIEIFGDQRLISGEKYIEEFNFYSTTFATPIYCYYKNEFSTMYENFQAKPTFVESSDYEGIMPWDRLKKLKSFK